VNPLLDTELRLLLVGVGARVTDRLLPGIQAAAVPLRVTAVCDPGPATPKRVAELAAAGLLPAGVAIHEHLDKALTAGPYEVAIVACPHDQHQSAALALMAAGTVVWKEKPFALTLDEAIQLAVQARSGLRILTPRPYGQLHRIAARFLPGWGRLLSYRIRITRQTSDYSQTWRACQRRAGGGAIIDLGYHALDLIARLADQPATVYAVSADSPAHRPDVEVEESAHLTITHIDGSVGTVYISRCDDRAEELDLVAEHGRITITGDHAQLRVNQHGGLTHTVDLAAADDPVAAMIRHHADTFTDNGETAKEIRVGISATALIEAAYTSLRLGRPVTVAAPDLPYSTPAQELEGFLS
jgi:predicted dehydrogenase